MENRYGMRREIMNAFRYREHSCVIVVASAMDTEITVVMNEKYQRHAQIDSSIPIPCFTLYMLFTCLHSCYNRQNQDPIMSKL